MKKIILKIGVKILYKIAVKIESNLSYHAETMLPLLENIFDFGLTSEKTSLVTFYSSDCKAD